MVVVATCLYLPDLYIPDECWECIFKFLNDPIYLKSLSIVSKQFISITNHMLFSLTVLNSTVPFLPHLFLGFTNLTSLSFNRYYLYAELDALLLRISHFPLKLTSLNFSNQRNVPNNGLLAFSQNITTLTSLTCSNITFINDTDLNLISGSFPLLEVLKLSKTPTSKSNAYGISEDGIGQILSKCRNIRHLNLAYCQRLKLRGINSVVSKLEVLDLSYTTVDDETLYVFSKSCRGLLKMLLNSCCVVTEKGVKHVVENCTQLRVFSLWGCNNVHLDVVSSMILSRPSLRNVPFHYRFSNRENELLSRQGCLII